MRFLHELKSIISTHQLENSLRVVSQFQFQDIISKIIAARTSLPPKTGQDYAWLWENLREPTTVLITQNPLDTLHILRQNEKYWLMIEDWYGTKKQGNYWLLEGQIHAIKKLLEELRHVEYYIVAHDFQWLLCENHHGAVIGSGNWICEQLNHLKNTETP